MNIKTEIIDSEKVPKKYTADGDNINPAFEITGLAEDVKSLVLIMEDPDAKRVVGHSWVHWVVFDIPVKNGKALIDEDSVPGKAGESTYKKREYGRPKSS